MKYGHVTGDKVEKTGSQEWYMPIQAEHLEQLEGQSESLPVATGQSQSPEALCSVNICFRVVGYGQAQATGRGVTPEEAVTHLTGTMAATLRALGGEAEAEAEAEAEVPPVVMNRYEKLGRLVTCGLEKAKDDTKLQERFLRAVQLVTYGKVRRGVTSDQIFYVESQGDDHTQYYVNGEATVCTCPDARKHQGEGGYKCKHILAVLLCAKLEGLV